MTRSPCAVENRICRLSRMSARPLTVSTPSTSLENVGGKLQPVPRNAGSLVEAIGSPADHDGGEADRDGSAMSRAVAEPRRGQSHDHHGRGSFDDAVRRTDADREVTQLGGGQATDQHGWSARPHDRPADMRDRRYSRCNHRALMHVGQSCGGRHGRFPSGQLIFTSAPLMVTIPLAFNSAIAFADTACLALACSVMLTALSVASAVACMARLTPALTVMFAFAVIVMSDALSMAMPLLPSTIEFLLLSLM